MKIFIGNLAPETSEAGLRTFFQNYAPSECKIIRSKGKGKPACAFVEIQASENSARNALETLNKKVLDGNVLELFEVIESDA